MLPSVRCSARGGRSHAQWPVIESVPHWSFHTDKLQTVVVSVHTEDESLSLLENYMFIAWIYSYNHAACRCEWKKWRHQAQKWTMRVTVCSQSRSEIKMMNANASVTQQAHRRHRQEQSETNGKNEAEYVATETHSICKRTYMGIYSPLWRLSRFQIGSLLHVRLPEYETGRRMLICINGWWKWASISF